MRKCLKQQGKISNFETKDSCFWYSELHSKVIINSELKCHNVSKGISIKSVYETQIGFN